MNKYIHIYLFFSVPSAIHFQVTHTTDMPRGSQQSRRGKVQDMDTQYMLIKLINATKDIEHSFGPTAVHAAQHPGGYLHKTAGIKKYKPNISALAHKSMLLEVIVHKYIKTQIYRYTNITIHEN